MGASHSHPLQIAEVQASPDHGLIGITFCPGKKQPGALTGAWDRDLATDLDLIRDWGAVAVVTLVEDHELESLKVREMGSLVATRHMSWYHLPIVDVSTPSEQFERRWAEVGEELRAMLREGLNIVVHCKGGLGRAGTIGARLLIELGMDPASAVEQVREARPGAIETSAQLAYVMGLEPIGELQPDTSVEAITDRAEGALLGLAIGDAVGTTLEFEARDTHPLLTDMVGGGPFRLKPGEWTDDTAMALALADSLYAKSELYPADLMTRFVEWMDEGAYSCTGKCFDIGITTRQALSRWKTSGDPIAGSTDPNTAGNGSLMRLAPVAIRFFNDRAKLRDTAALQSKTTHAAKEAIDACVVYAEMLADAIEGKKRSEVLRSRDGAFTDAINKIVAGSWRAKPRPRINASGYVCHSLEAALWSVARSGTFKQAVLTAANLGDDADTTAAIAGQLAGALHGVTRMPRDWVDKVAWSPRIRGMASGLLERP